MASLALKNIKKSFGNIDVIKGVDLAIEDGEFVVFVGPSGCGKSTLLRLIAGLEDITSGTLEISGRRVNELEPKHRGIGMVFQSYAIFPHMSVRENMAFGLTIRKQDPKEIDQRVNDAAQMLKMEDLLDRRPSQLSGGQRQRVAIGRAIVRAPEVFLFDEPLSNLDAALRMNTRMEIADLHKRLGSTMIYVTHDQVEAMTLADRIVVLKDGEVQQFGKPMELFHHPANQFVARFIGSPPMNFFDGVVMKDPSGLNTVQCDTLGNLRLSNSFYEVDQMVTVGIRPQYLELNPNDNTDMTMRASVVYTERLGGETVIGVTLANGKQVVALHAEDIELEVGKEVVLYYSSKQIRVFKE